MSFLNSINKQQILSRLVGGQPEAKQKKAEELLTDFFKIIAEQMAFGNRVIIRDLGIFETEEKQLPGKPATYTIKFTPGPQLKKAAKHLSERWPDGMAPQMKDAVTGMAHGGKGTGEEESIG